MIFDAAAFMFCFAGTAWAEEEWPKDIRPVPDADLTGKVVVLHTNDVHGAIQGYAKIVALRESFEKLGADVIRPGQILKLPDAA